MQRNARIDNYLTPREIFKLSLKSTFIWALNYLVFARLNLIIRKNSGPEAVDDQGAISVLAALFLLARLIETDQGKDAYILFLVGILIILHKIN